MKFSVDNILLFNTFGIPFVGADICGFNDNVSGSTCARWYKLGVIYPLARNHNNLDTDPQEPYIDDFSRVVDYKTNMTAQDIIRKAMLTRYGLHGYFYSLFHKASTDGILPIKPLFFNYPEEAYAYEYVHYSVLLGDAVLASIDSDIAQRGTYYYPDKDEKWCPIWEGLNNNCIQGGTRQITNIPLSEIYLHMKTGSIIPLQLSDSTKFNVTDNINNIGDLENQLTDLAIILSLGTNKAEGFVRLDNGYTTDLSDYDEIIFTAELDERVSKKNKLDISFNHTHSASTSSGNFASRLGHIMIYDAKRLGFNKRIQGTLTDIKGNTYALATTYNENMDISRIAYDSTLAIEITDIDSIHFQAQ